MILFMIENNFLILVCTNVYADRLRPVVVNSIQLPLTMATCQFFVSFRNKA